MMTSRQPTTKNLLDELDRLTDVLKERLPTIKESQIDMIALHLSDIAGEIPHFQKSYNALVQSEELSEDDFIGCMVELEISIAHILHHGKALKTLLKKALETLP
ncbi:hypothetical protein HYR99_23045 [Candidatus Poribacteria bacterium]|nr:hypothetical protein [Candidatus Poribacteria bacterium]